MEMLPFPTVCTNMEYICEAKEKFCSRYDVSRGRNVGR